jgi:hypothetical protein
MEGLVTVTKIDYIFEFRLKRMIDIVVNTFGKFGPFVDALKVRVIRFILDIPDFKKYSFAHVDQFLFGKVHDKASFVFHNQFWAKRACACANIDHCAPYPEAG